MWISGLFSKSHNVIKLLSKYIPCKIFGDPLQSIFDFDKNDHLISWNEVEKSYDFAGELDYPWRWNSNIELGNIINNYRNELLIGKIPNFLNGKNVQVINYSHENIIKKGYNLLNNKGSSCNCKA